MPVPNPTMPVKGAGTTLWVYKGSGDPYANPLSDVDWSRLAKVKDLTPGELTAESYDDSYLDDEDADWTATGQGQKSAGDTSFTLAWMPGEQGQQVLLAWFNKGDTRAYKIRFPNGTVDVFRGWVSSIGKAVTAKEVITRTVKVTNVGRPSMAEDRSTVTAATGMTVTPASTSVVKGRSITLTVAFQPEGATDKSFRAVSADKTKATVSVSGMTITVKGVAAGKVNIPVVSGNGELAVVAGITVSLFFSDPDMHPLDFSLLNRREADEEPEDDVLMQKAAGLAGGVRFGPDGNEVIPTSPDVADMTEDDVMLMTVSEGIAGGVRYG